MNVKTPECGIKNPMKSANTRELAGTLRNRLSEETKNLLEVKTPKEYIAGCKIIISIINAQIEAKDLELEEITAQLLSVKKEDQTNYEELQRKKEKLKYEIERLETKLDKMEDKKKEVERFGFPDKESAARLRSLIKRFDLYDVFYDKESNTYVVLYEYFGRDGCGTKIRVISGGNIKEKKFTLRDRDNRKNDNYNDYDKIENVKIDGDRVEVTVSSTKSEDTYAFYVAYKEPEKHEQSVNTKKVKKSVGKEDFKIIVEQKVNELISRYTKNDTYSICMEDENMLEANPRDNLGTEMSYDRPKLLSKKINVKSGKACIVIEKVQKDVGSCSGKQFCIVKCMINSEGNTISRQEYNYLQKELKNYKTKCEIEKLINEW